MLTGPKGVINDWRRFKLDSVDQTVPQKKRELLRQMSSPREDDKERPLRKVIAIVSIVIPLMCASMKQNDTGLRYTTKVAGIYNKTHCTHSNSPLCLPWYLVYA